MDIRRDPAHETDAIVEGAVGLEPGASIVVDEGDTAVIVERGMALRILPPGHHPVPDSFAGPSKEVYFVTAHMFADEQFGGRLAPVPLAEGPISSVSGKFAFTIVRPERALAHFGPDVELSVVAEWMRVRVMRAVQKVLSRTIGKPLATAQAVIPDGVGAELGPELSAAGISFGGLRGLTLR